MNNLFKAFEETYADRILVNITVEAHEFSPAFEKKMRGLFRDYYKMKATTLRSAKQIFKYAIIAALLAILAISVVAVMYWNHLHMEQHDVFSLLYIDDISDAPETIETAYEITADMTGFVETVEENNAFIRCRQYTNYENSINIMFSQMILKSVQGMRINTESTEEIITTLKINGYDAIYFETTSEIKNIVWDDSEYVFIIEAHGIGKDELIDIADSVQNVEK